MSNYEYEIKRITEVLETMKTMEPLPAIGSPEFHADIAAWQARRDQIAKCEQSIEILALMTVPDDVAVLVTQMREQRKALLPQPIFLKSKEQGNA